MKLSFFAQNGGFQLRKGFDRIKVLLGEREGILPHFFQFDARPGQNAQGCGKVGGVTGPHQPARFARLDEDLFRARRNNRAAHAHGLDDVASPRRPGRVRAHDAVYRTNSFLHVIGPVVQNDDVTQAVTLDGALHAALQRRGIGRIASGGTLRREDYDRVINAERCVMAPGGVDGHAHLDYRMGDVRTCDDFYSGSLAALAGGTTTIVDFCEPLPGQLPEQAIAGRMEQAKRAAVDYALHFVFTENYREELRHLEAVREAGIGCYKLFTTYPNTTLSYGDIETIFAAVGRGGVFLVHGEDNQRIGELCRELDAAGREDMYALFQTRRNEVEEISVRRLAALRRQYGVTLCIAHTSTKEALEIKRKEDPGLVVETCPHYLALTSQCYRRPDGGLYAVNPPLKGEEDRLALWEAAMDGTLDILSTDHCPYTREQKLSETSYKRTPCGLSGIQTRIPYLFSEGMARSMSLERFVALTSENAAKFYGLYPRKGCLRPGSDADVVLINRDRRCRFGREDFAGAEDYNIFEGWEFRGAVERVFLRGREVFAEGPGQRQEYRCIQKGWIRYGNDRRDGRVADCERG